jgi:hypothetical protein
LTPLSVRILLVLLGVTAFATVAVELLNWWVTDDGGYSLAVRTGWALLRSVGFLVLIWQVRRGRAGAPPFALILAVTTLFALARLVVPRHGLPHPVGLAGFAVLASLCTAVLLLLYRSPTVRDYLAHRPRLKRPPVSGWILTARVAALSYGPLMLVGAAVAVGQLFAGRLGALPLIMAWFAAGIVLSYATLLITYFLVKGKRWATTALVILSLVALVIDLPLCWILLGSDGLLRDGGPLAAAALLAIFAIAFHGRRLRAVSILRPWSPSQSRPR